ncbi:MAG: hypothetical protein H7Y00_03075 [Fimbriimonadaceae bacterium]|nr:hypothetical protein [Chitinophagales bacterium]
MENKITEMEILLDKMNRLFRNFKNSNQKINAIDIDLMKDYTKQFYELLSEYQSGEDVTITIQEKKNIQFINEPVIKHEYPKIEIPKIEIPEIKTPEIKTPEVKVEPKEVIHKTEEKKPEPVINFTETKKRLAMIDDDEEETEMNTALHNKLPKNKKTLAHKIKTTKTVDLRQSIDLNDKFFFIRELFKGDHNAFDISIRHINNLTSMDEVKIYIESELSKKYNWQKDSESMERFYEVISEKFSA